MQSQLDHLVHRFIETRRQTLTICEPLEHDDYLIQSADFVSPPKWHLGHTTWFFETFLLSPRHSDYQWFDARFQYLFNSYYKSVGTHLPRPERGIVSRPTLKEVLAYRRAIDEAVETLLMGEIGKKALDILELGIQHEQQHQELLLMDIKHIFFQNMSPPAYASESAPNAHPSPLAFESFEGGLTTIGHEGSSFCFDNEQPSHQVMLVPYAIANRAVTNGEFLKFIEAGGYTQPNCWLSDGWDLIQQEKWNAPLYWWKEADQWKVFTLNGVIDLPLNEPVIHVSGYEADAYARWAGARLPTEFEWETAFNSRSQALNDFGKAWEWTSSSYSAYPGFRAESGAIGEYNGKFMCNQWVLRGGASITPAKHIRPTYRNFFHPNMRWQFSGIRLARDEK